MGDNTVDLSFIPITSLKRETRNVISQLLNPYKLFPNDDGIARDWRGLAHLSGIPGEVIPAISNSADQTSDVLAHWSQNGMAVANLRRLQDFFEELDRFDVLDDTKHLFESDASTFIKDTRTRSVSSNSASSLSPSMLPSTPEHDVLTVQDLDSEYPQIYDAFVLFADEDIDFAVELIRNMENFGFKLCVKDRDLLGGLNSQHSTMLRLISERCNRLIVIVSPAFLESPANTFFIDYAQALGIEQRRRTIIPCLYKTCVLPPQLSYYFLLNYQRSGKLWNFWDKLRDSLRVTPIPLNSNQRAIIREVESSKCPEVQTLSDRENNFPIPMRRALPSAPVFIQQQIMPPPQVRQPTISITLSEQEETESITESPVLPAIFPPLGHTTSMVNINNHSEDKLRESPPLTNDSGLYVSVSDFTNSESLSISNNRERVKKRKWYRKFHVFKKTLWKKEKPVLAD